MSEVTAYHRKLAEAMEQVASGYDMSHGITAKSTRKDRVDHFAAVLASESVVDPESLGDAKMNAALLDSAMHEVERLKAAVAKAEKYYRAKCVNGAAGVSCKWCCSCQIAAALAALRSTGDSDE